MPDAARRAEIVAEDPVASVKAYYAFKDAWIHELLGFERHKQNPTPTAAGGLFGKPASGVIVDESQERGRLHGHGNFRMLGWPHPDVFARRMTRDEDYRTRVFRYLEHIIHQGGLDDELMQLLGAKPGDFTMPWPGDWSDSDESDQGDQGVEDDEGHEGVQLDSDSEKEEEEDEEEEEEEERETEEKREEEKREDEEEEDEEEEEEREEEEVEDEVEEVVVEVVVVEEEDSVSL